MQERLMLNQSLMRLIQAQTHDNAWLFEAAANVRLLPDQAADPNWNNEHWDKSWGKLEILARGPTIIVVWHRPDGAEPLADVSDLPTNIKMLRFALLGELIKGLQAVGQLSYVRVGHPTNWNKCKIYIDRKEVQTVVQADALLGVITVHHRDTQGKYVMNEAKTEFDPKRIAGHVEIKIEEKSQTIF